MTQDRQVFKAALFILASELMFASMGATVKAAVISGLPTEVLVFLRNLVGMFLILPFLLKGGVENLRSAVPHLHLLRAVMGVSAMYCFFYALGHLALADAMLLKMTAPIFMPIIAWLWLKERVSRYSVLAVPIGFLGVLLVLRPEGDFNEVALIGLAGGAFAALAKVTVRRLSRTEPATRIVFYFAILGALVSVVPLAQAWQMPSLAQWGMVIVIGLFGTLGQISLTRGYATAPTARISPFTYLSVVFGSAYGYLIWGEVLETYFVVGALLIAFAGILALRRPAAPASDSTRDQHHAAATGRGVP